MTPNHHNSLGDLGFAHAGASVSPSAKRGWSRFPSLPHGAVLRIHTKALCPWEEGDAEAKAVCD